MARRPPLARAPRARIWAEMTSASPPFPVFDIAVVGAGAAGLALAVAIKREAGVR